MCKAIYFDMDGTIYDLYNVPNWEPRLRSEDATAYSEGAALVDMKELNNLLLQFVALGVTIGVISWCAMNASKKYDQEVRNVKRLWIKQHLPCATEIHVVKYGTSKQRVANHKDAILVDDNQEVRNKWKGQTIDASKSKELLDKLRELLTSLQ